MRTLDQHVHTMSADHAHQQRSDQTHIQPGVLECIRHRQDPGADVSFQQVDHRVHVGGGVFQRSVQRGFVRFVGRTVRGILLDDAGLREAVVVVANIDDHVFRRAAEIRPR